MTNEIQIIFFFADESELKASSSIPKILATSHWKIWKRKKISNSMFLRYETIKLLITDMTTLKKKNHLFPWMVSWPYAFITTAIMRFVPTAISSSRKWFYSLRCFWLRMTLSWLKKGARRDRKSLWGLLASALCIWIGRFRFGFEGERREKLDGFRYV